MTYTTTEANILDIAVTPKTRVLINGDVVCTFGEFVADNAVGLANGEVSAIKRTIEHGEIYSGDCGAPFTVALAA
jgi:hypothetical protein